ncbi:MAG TPA: transglycosylase SLT domain-containing protein [Gammaproteobacteria bacterium]|jgi:soluble lytic murein transglycosylase-like protein|nr:transglycosylase SLT domain-containing protein [Gammaproteobacteria bacterium]
MRKAASALLLAAALPCTALATKTFKLTQPDPDLIYLVQQATDDPDDFRDDYDRQVWLTTMSTRMVDLIPDSQQRMDLLKLIHKEATRAKLPPELVLSVIQVESKFDAYAISKAGAVGMMQIMPFWLKLIGRPDDSLVHAQTNLRMGCTILKYYIIKTHGDLRAALQRYNGATVGIDYSDQVLKALSQRWYMDR